VDVAFIAPRVEVLVAVFPSAAFKSSPHASNVDLVVCGYPGVLTLTVVVVVVVHVAHFLQPVAKNTTVIEKLSNVNFKNLIVCNISVYTHMAFQITPRFYYGCWSPLFLLFF
jgi:hypothetical protein